MTRPYPGDRDLAFFARVAVEGANGNPVAPNEGEAAAAERLRRRSFICRDETRRVKPYLYLLNKPGERLLTALLQAMHQDHYR